MLSYYRQQERLIRLYSQGWVTSCITEWSIPVGIENV